MKELIQPEVEKIENEEVELDVPKDVFNKEMELLKKNPIKYIGDWAEGHLLHVGRKVFILISLMPISMIIPTLNILSGIKANFNIFLLGSPGCGRISRPTWVGTHNGM